MKKITFLLADMYKVGGVQRVVSIISNALSDRYSIDICSIFAENKDVAFELDPCITVYNIFTDHFDLRKNYIKGLKGVFKTIKKHPTDILIVCGMGLIPIVYPAVIYKNLRLIAWEHQCFSFGRKFGFEWLGKRIALKWFDNIIVLTKQDLEMYKKNKSKAGIVQIYNPMVLQEDKPVNIEKRAHRIISVGSLVPQKGFDYAIEIAQKIFSQIDSDWEWDIYGDGPDHDKLQSLIDNGPCKDRIHLCGYTKNISSIYKKYSLYCMTSRHEGFPMVLLEAVEAKLPILSFDCKCGPSDIIEEGVNGYLINQYDLDDFVSKLKMLICDDDKISALSNGKAKCEKEISLDFAIRKWFELIG